MDKASQNHYQPDYAIAPGEVIEHELELRRMSRVELAKRTGLSEKHIISVLKSKGSTIITPETAIKLERALGMPVDYWLNLEAQYQEIRARLIEQAELERNLGWLDRIPIGEMVKRGWLRKFKDKKDQLNEVLRFFGIASVAQWEALWPKVAVAYRQHGKQQIFPEAVSAWLRRGEIEAAAIDCQPFNKPAFRAVLDTIRGLTTEPEPQVFVPELRKRCASAGVAVVLVPGLPKTGLSGSTRWIKPDKALIQLSLRYKSDDQLWFTFFHEAGHILLHGKKELFLEGANGMDEKKEQQANEFARDRLIPARAFAEFKQRGSFPLDDIRRFAEVQGIAPGIIVGRLQHEGLLPRSHGNRLKVFYNWK